MDIKDKLITAMKHFSELEEYIDKTEDTELGLMVEIVKKYHSNLPDYIKQIKEAHVENHEKDKAGVIFSTVHRCKGLEYDEVTLVNDFITEDKIIKLVKEIGFNTLSKDKLAEEINLLYVAVTRTRNILNIPEELLPKSKIDVIPKSDISIDQGEKFMEHYQMKPLPKSRVNQRNRGRPWKPREDDELRVMVNEGKTVSAMAQRLGRSASAVRARTVKLIR